MPPALPLEHVAQLDRLAIRRHPILSAVRAKCLDCTGDQPAEVRLCASASCALWPFRFGVNPWHTQEITEEERERRRERAKSAFGHVPLTTNRSQDGSGGHGR